MKGSVEDIDASTKVVTRSSAIETTSGNKINSTTSGGYYVSTVVGSVSNNVQSKTDAGYLVLTGVQASVFSEEAQ